MNNEERVMPLRDSWITMYVVLGCEFAILRLSIAYGVEASRTNRIAAAFDSAVRRIHDFLFVIPHRNRPPNLLAAGLISQALFLLCGVLAVGLLMLAPHRGKGTIRRLVHPFLAIAAFGLCLVTWVLSSQHATALLTLDVPYWLYGYEPRIYCLLILLITAGLVFVARNRPKLVPFVYASFFVAHAGFWL
jgi:hypothetical protein